MDINERQLLYQMKNGRLEERHSAFERILFTYEKLIWHIAHRYISSNEDAEDIFQEACIKIYSGLPSVVMPESGTLKSWVCAVTANACLDFLRKQKAKPESGQLTEEIAASKALSVPSAEEEALAENRAEEILNALDKLQDNHKTLIILRDMNGLSYQELAEAAGVNINTVKSRLSRAREALKKIVSGE
jgi:RNA polymerase sigma-70 factor (ECF subfamily)